MDKNIIIPEVFFKFTKDTKDCEFEKIVEEIKSEMLEKTQETEKHSQRLINLTRAIGLKMDLSDVMLYELELLSILHDIGKMSVNSDILYKGGKLSDAEQYEMRKHPLVGFRIAMKIPDLMPISKSILYHHERWDGKGYPKGLAGTSIPLLSRILAVADSYDAMTNDRPYRMAMPRAKAMEEIRNNSGTQFDPFISRIFLEIIS